MVFNMLVTRRPLYERSFLYSPPSCDHPPCMSSGPQGSRGTRWIARSTQERIAIVFTGLFGSLVYGIAISITTMRWSEASESDTQARTGNKSRTQT